MFGNATLQIELLNTISFYKAKIMFFFNLLLTNYYANRNMSQKKMIWKFSFFLRVISSFFIFRIRRIVVDKLVF